MKEKVLTILKITFIVLLVGWMVLFVVDYFRAKQRNKPFICFTESTRKNDRDDEYYECISLGYKYFELKEKNGETRYGFGAAFIKSDIEKKWEE